MKRLLLRKEIMVLAILSLMLPTGVQASDTFVVFEPAADAWQLSNLTIGYAETEHSCVRLAAANLANDLEAVTGQKVSPLTSHPSSRENSVT